MIMLKAANNSNKSQLGLPSGIALGLSNSTSPTLQLFGSDAQSVRVQLNLDHFGI
jgi:hypothetical protein